MAQLKKGDNHATFAKILADGKFHVQCEQNEEGAEAREIESKDGEKKTVYEHLFGSLDGKISSLEIKEGGFGDVLYIGLDNEIVLTVGTANSFGTDLLKKIPNIDVEKEVEFKPFSFANEAGKSVQGVSVLQGNEKVLNYFFDAQTKTNLHDFPVIDEDGKPEKGTKEWTRFWRDYFENVEDFLVKHVKANKSIVHEEKEGLKEELVKAEAEADRDLVDPADVPF